MCSPPFPNSCGETAGVNGFDVRMENFQSTPTFFDLTYSQSSPRPHCRRWLARPHLGNALVELSKGWLSHRLSSRKYRPSRLQ